MRAHWFSATGTVAALLLSVPAATAQDPGTPGDRITVQGATPGSPQGEIGVQTRAAVTPEEQLTQAASINRRAGQLAERLSKMLDEARRDKDIMRANCVNRKLTEVNANTRNVEQRTRTLREAAAANDEARRSHEFTVLTVLAQKLEQLDQEATQCLGQSIFEPGASQVVTTIQRDSPTLDPTFIEPSTAAPPSETVPPASIVPEPASGFM